MAYLVNNFSEIRKKWFIEQVDRLVSSGTTKKDIALQLDVSAQYINSIYNGSKNATENFLIKFCKKFNISQKGLLNIMKGYDTPESDNSHINEPAVSVLKGKKNQIPLVSIAAVAGFGNAEFTIQERDVKDYYVIPKFNDRRIDFMIEVCGSSMYPKYNSGDVVACTIIRESKFIQWNKVHVIGTKEQGILVKRIKKGENDNHLLLVSDNKDYDPFSIGIDEITGIALVVGVIRLE
ncbi:MAG: hypothetical protein A2W90_18190 [Bacteroidetes bacterium GWF2_42_66]|nr:MAG: hypothetical protein A2W92_06180 [Bacteroidetes bacterium GWA2_42_15]OFX98183.1 MAG: hypothetical protein A2W89_09680 [Bacteroidetes bacterium GWE2_42_39]OFY42568.1 MAG: hypothetical protein A2W90_18190 [Bacteroidetes bacterium GWF2_42_66]HBL74284.1 hypothetical protein [Prolixibacteraceae bacterium]HCR92245.1 hypothetical protein [Prolixibacteraceae bacterium]